MTERFFICTHCGNLIGMIEDKGVPVVCCGEKMKALVANSTDAAQEKHVPVAVVKGNVVEVTVGSVPHPMTEEHHINWVYLQTKNGGQRKQLPVTGEPKVSFALENDQPIAVFAYCNLHGLWKAEL